MQPSDVEISGSSSHQELARRVERGEINEEDLCLEEVCTPVWPWAT